MLNKKVKSIILAAGKGTRMKSEKSKLVHKIYGKELVKRVVEVAQKSGVEDVVTVVGYKKEQVQLVLGDTVKYAYQEEMLGTGHAVMQAEEFLKDKHGKVIVLNGDVPILRPETIKKFIQKSIKHKEYATVLTAIYNNPTGYGRIVRDIGGGITGIVEEKDATEEQKDLVKIIITENGETKELTNTAIINYYSAGKITLIKTDENGKPLAGVEFTVYNASGDAVAVIVTDKNGVATTELLSIKDSEGTPLIFHATSYRYAPDTPVKVLLNAGVDIFAKNAEGKTDFEFCFGQTVANYKDYHNYCSKLKH